MTDAFRFGVGMEWKCPARFVMVHLRIFVENSVASVFTMHIHMYIVYYLMYSFFLSVINLHFLFSSRSGINAFLMV